MVCLEMVSTLNKSQFVWENGLIGGLEHEFYDFPLGISSQLTLTPWFFRGVGQPPTSFSSYSEHKWISFSSEKRF